MSRHWWKTPQHQGIEGNDRLHRNIRISSYLRKTPQHQGIEGNDKLRRNIKDSNYKFARMKH